MAIQYPVLLSSTLTASRPIKALNLSLNISLRDRSQASMTVSNAESPIPFRSFIDVYTHKGKFATFRVTNAAAGNERGRVYTLTHAIDTLRDAVYGMQGTFEGTKQEFLSSLFSYQKDVKWQLGYVEDGESAYKSPNINYTKLSDLFTKYLQDHPDVYPSYDFTTKPWTVRILKLPSAVAARFSLTRNADTCNVVYDDKNMCNRLYLSVNALEKVNDITKYNTELRVYENAASIAEYGVIEKTASVKTDEITNGDAEAWALSFLEKNAQPEVNITVDGYELYKQTGEIYDEASVGKRAVVSLPDYGVSTIQRIEYVQYPDVLNAPTAIVVSLATKQKTFTAAISNLETEVEKVGGVAGGAALSAADAEEVTDWILFRQKIDDAVNETGIVTLWESGIIVDAETGNKIYSLEQGFVSAFTQISNNSREVAIVAKEGQNNASAITANAQSITALSESLDAEGKRINSAELRLNGLEGEVALLSQNQADVGALQNSITLNSQGITALSESLDAEGKRINSAELRLDGLEGEVELKADSILLNGYVIASELESAIANVNYQNSQAIETLLITANGTNFNYLNTNSFTLGDTAMAKKPISMGPITTGQVLSVSTASLDLSHSHEVSVSDDGTVTLGAVSVTGGNFKIADTKIYKDGVSAAQNSVTASISNWATGQAIVQLTNDRRYYVDLPSFSATATPFNDNNEAVVAFYSGDIHQDNTLALKTVDASSVYQKGLEAGRAEGGGNAEITLSASGWAANINTVSAKSGDTVIDSIEIAAPTLTPEYYDFDAQNKLKIWIWSEASVFPQLDFTIDASNVFQKGEDSVTISQSGWDQNRNTVTATNGAREVVYLPEFTISGGTTFDANHTTKVYFTTESLEQPVKTATVDASSVYDEGYAAGWAAARAEVRQTTNSAGTEVWIYGPSATVDSSARFYTIGLDVAITSHVHNTVAGTITAQASGSVKVNSSTKITKTASSTINAGGGIM